MHNIRIVFMALSLMLFTSTTAWSHGAQEVPTIFTNTQWMNVQLRVVAADTTPEQAVQTVDISLFEWGISTNVIEVQEGTIEFLVSNDGNVPHALAITGNGVNDETEVFSGGQSRTLRVQLSPGEYDLWCPVPGHRSLGMETAFRASGDTSSGGSSIAEAIDTNSSGFIDDDEILEAVRLWVSGQPAPGLNQPLSDADMKDLIQLWVIGLPLAA